MWRACRPADVADPTGPANVAGPPPNRHGRFDGLTDVVGLPGRPMWRIRLGQPTRPVRWANRPRCRPAVSRRLSGGRSGGGVGVARRAWPPTVRRSARGEAWPVAARLSQPAVMAGASGPGRPVRGHVLWWQLRAPPHWCWSTGLLAATLCCWRWPASPPPHPPAAPEPTTRRSDERRQARCLPRRPA